jgi:hypothetical protein
MTKPDTTPAASASLATVKKDSAFGSRFNMYRLRCSAYAYNPDLREWEVFGTDSDGTINDLLCRCQNKAEAIEMANHYNTES